MEENNRRDSFEDFINELLSRGDVPTPDDFFDPSGNHEDTDDTPIFPTLPQDIQQIWDELMEEGPEPDFWYRLLTPLEQDTRKILENLIFEGMKGYFGPNPTQEQMKAVIRYTISLSWLVLAWLLNMHVIGDDDLEYPADPDIFF